MVTLFPNEHLICQSVDGNVNLTTHRVLSEYKKRGSFYKESILLEDITICESKETPYTWAVVIGLLFILSAFFTTPRILWGIVGAVFLVIYWNANKKAIIVSNATSTIKIKVDGMREEKIIAFVNKIEQAKQARIANKNNYAA